jgi:hypothetical protein
MFWRGSEVVWGAALLLFSYKYDSLRIEWMSDIGETKDVSKRSSSDITRNANITYCNPTLTQREKDHYSPAFPPHSTNSSAHTPQEQLRTLLRRCVDYHSIHPVPVD